MGILTRVSFAGEVPPVLACRAFSPVPVLRGGSDGWVQHAPVHSQRVQSHRRQGMWDPLIVCVVFGNVSVGGGEGPSIGWLEAFYPNTTSQPNSPCIYFLSFIQMLAVRLRYKIQEFYQLWFQGWDDQNTCCVISPDRLTSSECTIKHVYQDLVAACLLYRCVCGCFVCVCVRVYVTMKIHEKHSLQSPRASHAAPCDAVVSMSYKYTLLSSEGQQHSNTLISHPLLLRHTHRHLNRHADWKLGP